MAVLRSASTPLLDVILSYKPQNEPFFAQSVVSDARFAKVSKWFQFLLCLCTNKPCRFLCRVPEGEKKESSGQGPRPLSLALLGSSPKGRASGDPCRLHLFAKASPFDRLPPAGGRCRHRRQKGERGGTAIAMTERASLLKIKAPAAPPPGLGARVGRAQMLSRADHLFSGRGNRIRRVHQLFSQWRVMLPPCCWAAVRRLFRSGSWSGRPSGPSSGGVSV